MKMRGNPKLIFLRKIYCLAAVLILISSFAGCAAGSCLSYGHSCWGAHGKRSGGAAVARPMDSLPSGERRLPYGERWLLSRLVNRQLVQVPLAAKLHARMLAEQQQLQQQPPLAMMSQPPDDEPGVKHSTAMERLSGNADVRDISKGESRMLEGEPSDILLLPQQKDFANDDEAIKFGLFKILKNIDEKMK